MRPTCRRCIETRTPGLQVLRRHWGPPPPLPQHSPGRSAHVWHAACPLQSRPECGAAWQRAQMWRRHLLCASPALAPRPLLQLCSRCLLSASVQCGRSTRLAELTWHARQQTLSFRLLRAHQDMHDHSKCCQKAHLIAGCIQQTQVVKTWQEEVIGQNKSDRSNLIGSFTCRSWGMRSCMS